MKTEITFSKADLEYMKLAVNIACDIAVDEHNIKTTFYLNNIKKKINSALAELKNDSESES